MHDTAPPRWAALPRPVLLGGGEGRGLRGGEDRCGLLGDARALEEIRVLRAPQPHGVGEGDVGKIIRGDVAILDQLVGFGQRVAHVDHVEVPDIGAEDRIGLRPERVVAAEGGSVQAVVRLPAEIVGLGVKVASVLLLGDLAGREIVDIVDPAGEISRADRRARAMPRRCRHSRTSRRGSAIWRGRAYPDACAQALGRYAAPNARSGRRTIARPSRRRLREKRNAGPESAA
jgi:hypothetical protein